MGSLPIELLRHGRDAPLPERVTLRAGPLSVVFEEGALRSLRFGDREVLRAVYVAVRDRNWGTVPARLSELRVERRAAAFRITFRAEHRQGGIHFVWTGTLTGDEAATVTFAMEGTARSNFLRNRIGLCVLHPASAAGSACRVTHTDGSVEEGRFPWEIAPHQPFRDVAALAHRVSPGLWAEVRFAGEVFEMEDQRNWTDGSFKTYGTPLALPYPVRVTEGTRVSQSVTLSLRERPEAEVTVREGSHRLPEVGLGVASHGCPLSPGEVERLRVLRPAHLRIDLSLHDSGAPAMLRQATDQARALGAGLEVALLLSGDPEAGLRSLAAQVAEVRPPVRRWLILEDRRRATRVRCVALARRHLSSATPGADFGGGTDADFTNLNRDRPDTEGLDFLAFPLCPQVHAFDNASVVETLEGQGWVLESAARLARGKPLVVSPVTLKRRSNPDATGPVEPPPPGALPPQVDPRQMSLFTAAWTVGSLSGLARHDVQSVTFYETTGWRGVMETSEGSPLPERFPSLPGAVFPVYHVLADVAATAGARVRSTQCSDPLKVGALMLAGDEGYRMLLANLTAEPLEVTAHLPEGRVRLRRLDETTAEVALRDPEGFRAGTGEVLWSSGRGLVVHLLPYAVLRIDGESSSVGS